MQTLVKPPTADLASPVAILCPGCGALVPVAAAAPPTADGDGDGDATPASPPAAPGGPCGACGVPLLLADRYELRAVLGQNVGITYAALDRRSGRPVIVKELAIRRLDGWKTHELFQREVALLRQLRHPQVPALLDHFEAGSGKARTEYLVQELVPGEDLRRVAEHERFDERAVLDLLERVLDVLDYLHTRQPPVIHRDLKPSNLIRRPDGTIAVVDFGAARDVLRDGGGSTVAGTFGFMAPEQFRGEALPQSDLYGLGVTAVTLLARTPPEAMLTDSVTLDWRPHLRLSAPLAALVERLLRPDPAERPASAATARELVRAARRALDAPDVPAAFPLPPELDPSAPLPGEPVDGARPDATAPTRSRSSSVTPLVVGVLAIVIGGIFLASPPDCARGGSSSSVRTDPYEDLPACRGSDCRPLSASIGGLSFGMTVEEATRAVPGVTAVPGAAVVSAPLEVGGSTLACQLEFAVDERLSKVTCGPRQPLPGLAAHRQAEEALLRGLRAAYGPAEEAYDRPPPFGQETKPLDRTWLWQSAEAQLEVQSRYDARSRRAYAVYPLEDESLLRLVHVTRRHIRRAEAAEEAAQRRLEQRERAEQRSRE